MGRPSGVTHSTVRPDWAMSLALFVSQFCSRARWGRKQLKFVRAAERPHPLPPQVTLTPATDCASLTLMGRHNLVPPSWDRRNLSGPGPRRTISPHAASIGLCMGGPGEEKRQ